MPEESPTIQTPDKSGEVFSGSIVDTGKTFSASARLSLYASMTQAGLTWPVSCRNGTCRTCMARLAAGSVVYDIPWPGLSVDEKRDGFCLPCIARPTSDVALLPI